MPDVIDKVRVGFLFQHGGFVERGEGFLDVLGAVHKIQHKGVFLARRGAIEAREGLHGLDAAERLVHKHGVQLRLVKAGLVFFGHNQDVELFGEQIRHFAFGNLAPVRGLVQPFFRIACARVFDFAGKGHQSAHIAHAAFAYLPVKLQHIAHGVQA